MSETDMDSVRRRPAMYLGGTDERALHRLVEGILNNAFDEAVTSHADLIEMTLKEDGSIMIADNGRGIPVEIHPKFPGKSAVEVVLTMLHSGGLYSHRQKLRTPNDSIDVQASVVNALSDWFWIEVVRNKTQYRQSFSKGTPTSRLINKGPTTKRRGTTVCFHPDPEIFGLDVRFSPSTLYEMARSRARLYGGVEIKWSCETGVADGKTPIEQSFHFPTGSTG